MYDLGVVTHLAERGEGVAYVQDFIAKNQRRHGGLVAAQRRSVARRLWILPN
jgi:DSF synthase